MRLRHLPDDFGQLQTAWSAPALIVDLRYPAADGKAALPADLTPRSRSAPLFVLVGAATPPALLATLRERAPGLITLGLAAPAFTPDIVLTVKPVEDRRAYDALDAGTSIESLTSEKGAKPRFNEAVLAREHENGEADDSNDDADSGAPSDASPPATPPAPPDAAAPAPPAKAPAPVPAPLKDIVLERAVQLHRALLALGMLPGH